MVIFEEKTHLLWVLPLVFKVHFGGVDKCIGQKKNTLPVNTLERQSLGASFELYTGTISRMITSLRLIKIIAS